MVESRLRDLRSELDPSTDANLIWDAICQICRSTALEVCGVLQEYKGAPWLQHHAREALELDVAIIGMRQRESRKIL